MVPQHADIAQREGETAAKARIARRRRIADKHDAVAVGMIGPGVRRVERGERSDGLAIPKPICRCTGGDGFIDESLLVLAAAERRARAMLEDEIGAEAAAADREDNRKPLYLGVWNKLHRILRQREPPVKGADGGERPRIPSYREAGPSPDP